MLASTYIGVITTDLIYCGLKSIRLKKHYQNPFSLCLVEMVMFAVLQQYAFSAHDYSGEVRRRMIDAQKKLEKMTR
jgi:hypothetical protein